MYYHGESIAVNVHIQNNSNKTVKKIKVAVQQVADICIFTTAQYTCDVDKIESWQVILNLDFLKSIYTENLTNLGAS